MTTVIARSRSAMWTAFETDGRRYMNFADSGRTVTAEIDGALVADIEASRVTEREAVERARSSGTRIELALPTPGLSDAEARPARAA